MNASSSLLVVDDDDNDLRMLAGVLTQREGAAPVQVAHDGAEALDYLYARGAFAGRSAEPPGLIILDLHMPRVNGWEVLRQVKSDPNLRRIPIVIFSSSARDADVLESYDLGANAYVVKPINFELFQQTIRAIENFWLLCNHAAPAARLPAGAALPPPRRAPRARLKSKPA